MRIGQAVLIGALTWLATRSILTLAWLAATVALTAVDALLFRAAAAMPDNRRLRAVALVELALMMVVFAAIGPLILLRHSPISLAEQRLCCSAPSASAMRS